MRVTGGSDDLLHADHATPSHADGVDLAARAPVAFPPGLESLLLLGYRTLPIGSRFDVHIDKTVHSGCRQIILRAPSCRRSPAPGRPGRRAQGLGTTINIEAKTRYANQAGPLAPARHAKSIRNKECEECHAYTYRRQGHGKASPSRH